MLALPDDDEGDAQLTVMYRPEDGASVEFTIDLDWAECVALEWWLIVQGIQGV